MTRHPYSPAFTLLETVIAMTLMSLLMAIVWTMFSVYTKLEAKGRRVVGEAIMARAIDRQLRSDLLHIVAIDPPLIRESDSRSVTDATLETSQTEESTGPSDSIRGYFYGTANEMSFVVRPGGSVGEKEPELRVISYQPRSRASSNPDDTISGSRREVEDVSESDSSQETVGDPQWMIYGMDRHDRSWSSYWENGRVDESSGPLLSTNRPIALDEEDLIKIGSDALGDEDEEQNHSVREDKVDEIPELKRIRFRYFDGRNWLEEWDSDSEGRLPLALDIGFDLQMEDQSDSANRSLSEFSSASSDRLSVGNAENADTSFTSQYRLTVAIAAAIRLAPLGDGDVPNESSAASNDALPVSEALP